MRDIPEARDFYASKLGFVEGRSDDHWVDFDMFGHQLVVIDDFIIEPYTRFEGLPGEQKTMFFQDPSGNALEFKAFKDIQGSLYSSA